VVAVGTVGLIGHIFNIAILKYQIGDLSNAMALPSAIYLMLLGLAAYSREREGP
jgi:hypothetical protein